MVSPGSLASPVAWWQGQRELLVTQGHPHHLLLKKTQTNKSRGVSALLQQPGSAELLPLC